MKKRMLFISLLVASIFLTACKSNVEIAQNVQSAIDAIEEGVNESSNKDDGEQDLVNPPEYETECSTLDVIEMQNFYTNYDRIKITSEEFPELKKAVSDYFDKYENKRRQDAEELISSIADENSAESYTSYSCSSVCDVRCADSNLFSILITYVNYKQSYDEEGLSLETFDRGYDAVTFNSQTGEIVEFKDLGNIEDSIVNNFAEIHDLVDENNLLKDVDTRLNAVITADGCKAPFFIDGRGLNLVFDQYDILEDSCISDILYLPPVVLNITFDEMPGFNSKLLPGVLDYKITLTNATNDSLVDIDNNGKKEKLSFSYDVDENEWPYNSRLYIDDNEYSTETDEYSAEGYNAYYYNVGGRSYVYVERCYSNDWVETYLFEIKDGKPELCINNIGRMTSFTRNGVVLDCRIDLLGTWGVTKEYVFDDTQNIMEKDGLYYTSAAYDPANVVDEEMNYRTITVAKEFTDKNGKTLAKGTVLYPVITDGELYIMFQDKDYNKYEFDLTEGGDDYWGYYIDGMKENELFESLPYVG